MEEMSTIKTHSAMDEQSNSKCQECKEVFKSAARLDAHMWRHTGIKPYHCLTCSASFTQMGNLKIHQRIHTGERPYECSICFVSFSQISHLKNHQKLHTGEKPYKCDVCNAGFRQRSNLNSHRLIHTGEKPFKCTVCDSSFTQSSHLKNHFRRHTNEKPFICLYCSSTFRQMANLKSHERIHTGERSFSCSLCQLAFRQKSNLNSHIRKAHPESLDSETPHKRGRKLRPKNSPRSSCPKCKLLFNSAKELLAHKKGKLGHCTGVPITAEGDTHFKCMLCPSVFKIQGNLLLHAKTKHEDSLESAFLNATSNLDMPTTSEGNDASTSKVLSDEILNLAELLN